MYVIDIRHYLDDKGDIGPAKGPARKMADFITDPKARAAPPASSAASATTAAWHTGMTDDDTVVWHCPACGTEGRISNWLGTFWDLSHGLPSD